MKVNYLSSFSSLAISLADNRLFNKFLKAQYPIKGILLLVYSSHNCSLVQPSYFFSPSHWAVKFLASVLIISSKYFSISCHSWDSRILADFWPNLISLSSISWRSLSNCCSIWSDLSILSSLCL